MSSVPASHHREFTELYQNHHRWLYGWLHGKLGNTDDADDLAQDTFARLLGVRDLGIVREPRAYLRTVAKGLVVNLWQRRSLERAYIEALAVLPEEYAPSPEQRTIVLETLFEIDAMLDALPPLAKRTFLLSQFDGMKYEEIAVQLKISLSTVKRNMKLAFLRCLETIA